MIDGVLIVAFAGSDRVGWRAVAAVVRRKLRRVAEFVGLAGFVARAEVAVFVCWISVILRLAKVGLQFVKLHLFLQEEWTSYKPVAPYLWLTDSCQKNYWPAIKTCYGEWHRKE